RESRRYSVPFVLIDGYYVDPAPGGNIKDEKGRSLLLKPCHDDQFTIEAEAHNRCDAGNRRFASLQLTQFPVGFSFVERDILVLRMLSFYSPEQPPLRAAPQKIAHRHRVKILHRRYGIGSITAIGTKVWLASILKISIARIAHEGPGNRVPGF